jgi:hypothetical protein
LAIEERLEFSCGHTPVSPVLRNSLRVVVKIKIPKMPFASIELKSHFPLAYLPVPPNPHALWNH